MKWPHLRLPREKGGKVPQFDNLAIAQLVRGELEIINSTYLPILQEECSPQLFHLQNLLRLAHKHDWLDVLNFHGTVLEKIQGGELRWQDSFDRYEKEILSSDTLKSVKQVNDSTKKNAEKKNDICYKFIFQTCDWGEECFRRHISSILLAMHRQLDLSIPFHQVFWAACLLGFNPIQSCCTVQNGF